MRPLCVSILLLLLSTVTGYVRQTEEPSGDGDIIFSGAGSGCGGDDEDDDCDVGSGSDGIIGTGVTYHTTPAPPSTTARVTPSPPAQSATGCDDEEDCDDASGSGSGNFEIDPLLPPEHHGRPGVPTRRRTTTMRQRKPTPTPTLTPSAATATEFSVNERETSRSTPRPLLTTRLVYQEWPMFTSKPSTTSLSAEDQRRKFGESLTQPPEGAPRPPAENYPATLPPIAPVRSAPTTTTNDMHLNLNPPVSMSLNIGLIVGISAGLLVLLLVLAYALYKFKSRDEANYKTDNGKRFQYQAAPLVAAPVTNGDFAAKAVTAAPKSGKKKDVKEWYV